MLQVKAANDQQMEPLAGSVHLSARQGFDTVFRLFSVPLGNTRIRKMQQILGYYNHYIKCLLTLHIAVVALFIIKSCIGRAR